MFRHNSKARRLEAMHRQKNPQGMMVVLECAHGCLARPPQGHVVAGRDDIADLGIGTSSVTIPATWETRVLAVDDSGALYADPFCPGCSRKGRRETVTSENIGGLLTASELSLIGDRIYTVLFLLSQMLSPEDYRKDKQIFPVISVNFIGFHSAQSSNSVFSQVIDLVGEGWLICEEVEEKPKLRFSFGPKWDPFFARINEKVGTAVREAPKKCLAIDCGHESHFMFEIEGRPAEFLGDDPDASILELIATGELKLTRPALCPSCFLKESQRG